MRDPDDRVVKAIARALAHLEDFDRWHDENTDDDGDPLDYTQYDEGRADFGEDANVLLRDLLDALTALAEATP